MRLQTFRYILFGFCSIASIACNTSANESALNLQVVPADSVVASENYRENLDKWKKIYEQCMGHDLFPNALYMGLQENVMIGSISNKLATNVNGRSQVLDTSQNKNVFNLLAVMNTSNCGEKIILNDELKRDFYIELLKAVNNSVQYQYLTQLIDTNRIVYKISTFVDNTIRPDSLISLMERTKDSSLLHYKELLLTTGNALLLRTVMILGFYCEFPLTKKLTAEQTKELKNEVTFSLDQWGGNCIIRLMPNESLQIFINKRYTVFGQFYIFKKEK